MVLTLALAACGPAPVARGIDDPFETQNRRVHAFNKGVDRALGGGGEGTGRSLIPRPARRGLINFTSNLDMPRVVVNDVLQGNVDDAVHNSFRFLVNSTFGLAGLLDPAADMGLTARDTDFGETLHVWGVGEGRYVELPIAGPSTERDAVGKVVDFALNPLKNDLPVRERNAAAGLSLAGKAAARQEYAATIDSILYGSADSYAQARLLYLQNRRFQLSGEEALDAAADPYDAAGADPYDSLAATPYRGTAPATAPAAPADPSAAAYDPYEDPNVQF